MQFFTNIPDRIKGILLIIAGFIVLFDSLGWATQILHTLVLLGAIGMIILGVYLADIHTIIYKILTKNNTPE